MNTPNQTASQVEVTPNTLLFPNLFTALCYEANSQSDKFKQSVNELKELKEFDTWYFKDMLPKSKKITDFNTVEALKSYLCKRSDLYTKKKIESHLNHLLEVGQAAEFKYFNIQVEWKRSRTWGNNPRGDGYDYNGRYDSGSISGCGYDKLSTAVASVLNQSLALKKALYLEREKDVNTPLRELFGYGSGYRILPYFEGGVGTSCYPRIFEKIGFTFRQTASGKTFDCFEVTSNK